MRRETVVPRRARRGLAGRVRPGPPAALVARGDARRGGDAGGLDDRAHARPGQDRARRLHAASRPRTPTRLVVAPGGRGVAVRAHPAPRRRPRSSWPRRTAGTRVAIELEQKPRGWSRFAPLQFRAAGKRQVRGRRSTGLERLFAMRWWGWGEDGHDVALPEHAAGHAARPSSGSTRRAGARPVALEEVRLPELAPRRRRRASGWPAWWGRSTCATTALARVGARRRAQLPRPGAAARGRARRRARRGGLARARPTRCAALLAACAEARVAVVPFGGGTSVVGGVEPLRGRLRRRVISLDLRRLDALIAVDRTSLTATLEAGPVGPAGRGAAGGRGPDARPLPAVVRVLDGRRLGGHALGRPGLDRLRPDRRARRGAAPGRAGGRGRPPRRCPAPRPGRTCASCWSAPRACSA